MKPIQFLLLLLVAASYNVARAEVDVLATAEDGINDANTDFAKGVVWYKTGPGLFQVQATNGATYSASPDLQPGHQYFSGTASAVAGTAATATADTANGVLRGYAIAGLAQGFRTRQAFATPRIDDSVTFTNSSSQTVPITVHWHVDGTLSAGPNANSNAYHDSLLDFIGSGGRGGRIESHGLRHQDPANNYDTWSQNGWDQAGESYQVVPNAGGVSGISFTGHLMLPPGQTTFGVTTYVAIAARGGSSAANFSNSAGLSFELPTNVSYTSASGLFLSHGRRSDFNRDSFPDYVLFNSSSHRSAIWYLQANALHNAAFGPTLPAGWRIACIADINMDGKADYVLFNPSTRSTAIWSLNDNVFTSGKLGPTLPNGWSLIAAVDFNDDRSPDYVLFNATSRRTAVWYLHDNTLAGSAYGPVLPAGWSLSEVNDFNGDGKPDLAIIAGQRHVAFWYLNGMAFTGSAYGPVLPTGWMLQGTADFNRDSKPDFVLLNASTQQTAFWYLNGNALAGTALGPAITAGWDFVGP